MSRAKSRQPHHRRRCAQVPLLGVLGFRQGLRCLRIARNINRAGRPTVQSHIQIAVTVEVPHKTQRRFPTRFFRVLPDDGNRLSWGDVVAGSPVFLPRDTIEILFDKLFSARQSIASAHDEIMACHLTRDTVNERNRDISPTDPPSSLQRLAFSLNQRSSLAVDSGSGGCHESERASNECATLTAIHNDNGVTLTA
jgi:hypothetical protein